MSDELPYFPLYATAFWDAVLFWPCDRLGAYWRCLLYQWKYGGVPGDNEQLMATLLNEPRARAARLWELVRGKFQKGNDGLYWNVKLEEVRTEALVSVTESSNRGKAAASARWHRQSARNASAYASALPNAVQEQSDMLSTGNASKNKSKKEEERTPIVPTLRTSFETWWAEYPAKKAKGAAWRVWQRLKPDAALVEQMRGAVAAQRRSRQWREGFIPNPSTWLAGERWSDEVNVSLDVSTPMVPFWDECPTCSEIHPRGQACPVKHPPKATP